ncbi:MAG: NAD(P)-binding domain-containing protein, partial [Betaproteobacteria bacterium]
MSRVGVIGLGAMGMGVAQSLVRGGFEVHAYDVRQAAVDKIVAAGGHGSASPAELAKNVDALVVLVLNADQSEAVLFGENGAASGLAQGSVVIA